MTAGSGELSRQAIGGTCLATRNRTTIWGIALPILWLLLGCIASTPSLEWLAYIGMLPALFLCGLAIQLIPWLPENSLLVTGGHGPPWPTRTSVTLVYFIPAMLGFAWQVVHFFGFFSEAIGFAMSRRQRSPNRAMGALSGRIVSLGAGLAELDSQHWESNIRKDDAKAI